MLRAMICLLCVSCTAHSSSPTSSRVPSRDDRELARVQAFLVSPTLKNGAELFGGTAAVTLDVGWVRRKWVVGGDSFSCTLILVSDNSGATDSWGYECSPKARATLPAFVSEALAGDWFESGPFRQRVFGRHFPRSIENPLGVSADAEEEFRFLMSPLNGLEIGTGCPNLPGFENPTRAVSAFRVLSSADDPVIIEALLESLNPETRVLAANWISSNTLSASKSAQKRAEAVLSSMTKVAALVCDDTHALIDSILPRDARDLLRKR